MSHTIQTVLDLHINAKQDGNTAADTPTVSVDGLENMSVSDIGSAALSNESPDMFMSPISEAPSTDKAYTTSDLFKSPCDVPMPKQTKPIYTIVLTGGPCGGKTTALSHISKYLERHGYYVLSVPEVPTIMITGGCQYPGLEGDVDELIQFEVALLRMQQQLEETFMRVAVSINKPCVLLLDRAMADPAAYLPEYLWKDILSVAGLDERGIMERYDSVLHLETVAKKAEQFYTTSNNTARSESIEEACILDDKVLQSWISHPQLHVFDNSTDFDGKLHRILTQVAYTVGIKPPTLAHHA